MKEFLGRDFLIDNETGLKLFEEHAKGMPIFDFHCHLVPEQIAKDYRFRSLTEVWLGANGYGDHYKWRLLREMGVSEDYITGDRSDWEKFLKYAECMPYFVGNPIYEWTHLELRRYFGIDKTLSPATAKEIYEACNKKLQTLTARKMMESMNVKIVFTTDDPIDDLRWHEVMKEDKTLKTDVRPCWRPDKVINVERPHFFIPEIRRLGEITGIDVSTLAGMLKALDTRLDFFQAHGCVASDHALDVIRYAPASYEQANEVYLKGLRAEVISPEEEDFYKGYLLIHLGKEYRRRGIVQQYHIGALRNNNARGFEALGADTGYDAAEDQSVVEKTSALLNALNSADALPKTVLYTLNEKDYLPLVTLMNCFQGEVKGKMQLGTAWWFNDHFDGMNRQIAQLGNDGLLSCFIGMLTDSRSFLSYPRHEYFRRLICNYLGQLVESGRYPADMETLGQIVEDICYRNAFHYFNGK